MRRGRPRIPAIDRIALKCRFEDRGYRTPCRIYTGGKRTRGYGSISSGSRAAGDFRTRAVHIVTYEHVHGPVPEGLELDHLCRQHDCCEVTHLEAVTHAENCRRGIAGEIARQRAAAVTHCPKGHEYTPENTTMRPHYKSGHMCRFCNECARQWARKAHARNRAIRLAAIVAASLALMCGVAFAKSSREIPSPPTAPCNLGQRLNVHIVDGWMYSCDCQVLATGFHCEWNLVGQVEPANAIRRPKKARRVIVRYSLPAVVG